MHRLNTNFHSAGIMQPNHINDLNEVHCRIKVWQCSIIQSQRQSMCNFQILRHRERPPSYQQMYVPRLCFCRDPCTAVRLSVNRSCICKSHNEGLMSTDRLVNCVVLNGTFNTNRLYHVHSA